MNEQSSLMVFLELVKSCILINLRRFFFAVTQLWRTYHSSLYACYMEPPTKKRKEVTPDKQRSYTFVNPRQNPNSTVVWMMKGGVGKTSTAISIGEQKLSQFERVVFFDTDPQCALTTKLTGIDYTEERSNLVNYLDEAHRLCTDRTEPEKDLPDIETFLQPVTRHIDIPSDHKAFVLPGSRRIPFLDGVIHMSYNMRGFMCSLEEQWLNTFGLLREAICNYADKYPNTYFVFDTAPTSHPTTMMAVCAARNLVIPLRCGDDNGFAALSHIKYFLYGGVNSNSKVSHTDFCFCADRYFLPFRPMLEYIYLWRDTSSSAFFNKDEVLFISGVKSILDDDWKKTLPLHVFDSAFVDVPKLTKEA